jgi:phospholipid/cholesterol/gamma-HCH transport system permease protein
MDEERSTAAATSGLPLVSRASTWLAELGGLSIMTGRATVCLFRRPFRLRLILQQMEHIGYQSLPIVLLTSAFTGMVLVLQTGIGLERFGAKLAASGVAAIAFAREIGPVLTSVVLAGRVAAGIAAEIGTMRVTEQVDAMESLAVDPIHYLVVPRLLAAIIMIPALVVLADLIGILGGVVVAVTRLGLTARVYWETTFDYLTMRDFLGGLAKSPFFGAIIALIGCYCGFRVTGGAQGVGRGTTTAVVVASITILVANYFLTNIIIEIMPQVVPW